MNSLSQTGMGGDRKHMLSFILHKQNAISPYIHNSPAALDLDPFYLSLSASAPSSAGV